MQTTARKNINKQGQHGRSGKDKKIRASIVGAYRRLIQLPPFGKYANAANAANTIPRLRRQLYFFVEHPTTVYRSRPRPGKNAKADEAKGPGVVLAVACRCVCAQPAAAEAGSTTRLAGHHSAPSVPLVAEPTAAHQGCRMGIVSSVRHLGPGGYSGCMYRCFYYATPFCLFFRVPGREENYQTDALFFTPLETPAVFPAVGSIAVG